jgi:ABC-type siderophore export system fused ATPase/permease subunit
MNVSFIVTLLYLMGPISMLVSEIHEFTKMAIAVERIGEFNQQINAAKGIEVGHGDTTPINETFESLEFENVTYEYYDEKKAQTFRLQPLNLKVRKGESLFLTGLSEIIQLDDSKNKLKTTLSKGQQKRLALILSLLENKDILVLDEWAAEQDPLFREYFYKQIIPELKDMGKTVIAVTHDDAYFDCAERIVKFDFGRIASDTKLLKREAAVVD